jgi:hypothetical protein
LHWYAQVKGKKRKRGRQDCYSDACIELCLTIKALYKLTYRQVQGYVESFFEVLGIGLKVPCYTQMSRRAGNLKIRIRHVSASKAPIDIAIDGSGLKVYGEGEWKVRQHGTSKHRTWKKLHLGVDPLSHEVLARKVTPKDWTDDLVFGTMLNSIPGKIDRVFADGAYDSEDCYRESYERNCSLIAPPQINAIVQEKEKVPWLEPRDKAIRRISELKKSSGSIADARDQWKYEADYHSRSIVETAFYRFKRILGASLWSLKEKTQQVEAFIKVNILNHFTSLGMPVSSRVLP